MDTLSEGMYGYTDGGELTGMYSVDADDESCQFCMHHLFISFSIVLSHKTA